MQSICYSLPYNVHSSKSLSPAFKWSKGRSKVSIVLGIPTVKRDGKNYLLGTLKSIFDNIPPEEEADVLVVIFIAETDLGIVIEIANSINEGFSPQLESGILEIISPPLEYYPDLKSLAQTLGKLKNDSQEN